MTKPKILGVITARGGSKGIKRKNIKLMLGRPLLAYTIIPALKSELLTDVVVTSEDDEILKIAEAYGAPTIRRPAELAQDNVPTVQVLEHALAEMERKRGEVYEYLILLQPTTPLRTVDDINGALNELIKTNADSIISVVPTPGVNPEWMKYVVNDQLVDYDATLKDMSTRQSMKQIYIRNGCIYAAKRDLFLEFRSFKCPVTRPYIMDAQLWANIDTNRDWILAEAIMKDMDWTHIPTWEELSKRIN